MADIARRIRLTNDELLVLVGLTAGKTGPVLQGLHSRFLEAVTENADPEHQKILKAYREGVTVKDGECEVDDDAEVSVSDEDGAYVMAWTWVAGTPCRTCHTLFEDGGDGFDGECPSCADKSDEEAEDAA